MSIENKDMDASVPSRSAVRDALIELGGSATASAVCSVLVGKGFKFGNAQLGIQRCTEQGGISIADDWSLEVSTTVEWDIERDAHEAARRWGFVPCGGDKNPRQSAALAKARGES